MEIEAAMTDVKFISKQNEWEPLRILAVKWVLAPVVQSKSFPITSATETVFLPLIYLIIWTSLPDCHRPFEQILKRTDLVGLFKTFIKYKAQSFEHQNKEKNGFKINDLILFEKKICLSSSFETNLLMAKIRLASIWSQLG